VSIGFNGQIHFASSRKSSIKGKLKEKSCVQAFGLKYEALTCLKIVPLTVKFWKKLPFSQ
jgi:hypothetical protein